MQWNDGAMAALVLGPILRRVDETSATVWVETDAPCEVGVLGARQRTFHVAGHHYAIVCVTGLEPGSTTPYEVHLDGERVWPRDPRWPDSVIRTSTGTQSRVRFAYGSCRSVDEGPHVHEGERAWTQQVDALALYGQRMATQPVEEWPDLLVLLGDQVYAEHGNPRTRELIRTQRDVTEPPHDQCLHFAEFAHTYRETWGDDDAVRFLLSTVPSAMIFDDHELHDDWNISEAWVRDAHARPWWGELASSALMAYWLYQQLGNMSVDELRANDVLAALQEAEDGEELLRAHALRWDRGGAPTSGIHWSHRRDVGPVRLLMIDSRNGRVLRDGRREMLDDEEFDWLEEQAGEATNHLVLGTSIPVLLPHAAHHLEAWCEAVAAGAWGRLAARGAEKLRRAVDSERWPAFMSSFQRLMTIVRRCAAGELGPPPSSVLLLSGDIHHGYLAEARFPGGHVPVWQSVCSPFRFPLDTRIEHLFKFVSTPPGEWASKLLARLAGVPTPEVQWRIVDGPYYPNQIATLTFDGPQAAVRHECVTGATPEEVRLEVVGDRTIAASTAVGRSA